MKAYRGLDGKLRLFRPWLNCSRLKMSNERVCLPTFDPDELLQLISAFLRVEGRRWLPDAGSDFYLRPFIVGTGSSLGIQSPAEALLHLIAVLFPQRRGPPTGSKLIASSGDQIRAWPGGFGYAKVIRLELRSWNMVANWLE